MTQKTKKAAQRSAAPPTQRTAALPKPPIQLESRELHVGTVVIGRGASPAHSLSSSPLTGTSEGVEDQQSDHSSAWIRDLVEQKKQRSDDAVERMKQVSSTSLLCSCHAIICVNFAISLCVVTLLAPLQRADKVQKARRDLQERIKSIRSLVSSTTKSFNDDASPAAVERRLAAATPQRTPEERHTSIPARSISPKTPGRSSLSHVDDR